MQWITQKINLNLDNDNFSENYSLPEHTQHVILHYTFLTILIEEYFEIVVWILQNTSNLERPLLLIC